MNTIDVFIIGIMIGFQLGLFFTIFILACYALIDCILNLIDKYITKKVETIINKKRCKNGSK